jgi:copper chaperone CopZ
VTRPIVRFTAALVVTAVLCCACDRAPQPSSSASGPSSLAAPLELAIDLPVEGMTCSGCEDAIRMAVERLPGVKSCKCDHVAKSAHVVFDVAQVGKTRIVAAIREVGYVVPIVDEGGCSAVEPALPTQSH